MQVMREVNIRPVLNGFVVTVGCQTLVFNEIEEVANQLIAYQKAPAAREKQFVENAVNKTMGEIDVPQPVHRANRIGAICSEPTGARNEACCESAG